MAPGLAIDGLLAHVYRCHPCDYLYYATYEYLHWCMHLPKERRVEKQVFFIVSTDITSCTIATCIAISTWSFPWLT